MVTIWGGATARTLRAHWMAPGFRQDAIVVSPGMPANEEGWDRVVVAGHPAFRLSTAVDGWMPFDDARLMNLYAEDGRCDVLAGVDGCVFVGRRPEPLGQLEPRPPQLRKLGSQLHRLLGREAAGRRSVMAW